jgi:hypothetical protein
MSSTSLFTQDIFFSGWYWSLNSGHSPTWVTLSALFRIFSLSINWMGHLDRVFLSLPTLFTKVEQSLSLLCFSFWSCHHLLWRGSKVFAASWGLFHVSACFWYLTGTWCYPGCSLLSSESKWAGLSSVSVIHLPGSVPGAAALFVHETGHQEDMELIWVM